MPDIFLIVDGQQTGPYSVDQVRSFLRENKISPQTPAWHEGLTDWGSLEAILAAFPTPVATPPAYVPPPVVVRPKEKMSGCVWALVIGGACMILIVPCLFGIALGPITAGIEKAKENMAMQGARSIELAMYQYSVDHHGAYPDGASSTEVFQKLIDGGYVSNPSIFYISMLGKTRPLSNHLAPENVCYDVTSGVTTDTPEGLPVVFSSGYTVSYAPGGAATRDTNFPVPFLGMDVAYKDHSARWLKPSGDGSVMNVIPANFDAGGKSYRQLRP